MANVVVLNYNPSIKYIDQYLLQLAILSDKPKDLDSFLDVIVSEIESLEKHGLVVQFSNGDTCKSKVHLVMSTGDISQVAKLCHHKGHMARFGC